MPRKTTTNLYVPHRPGFHIYHFRKNGDQRWTAFRKWPGGLTRSTLVYSVDEARAFLDALPDDPPMLMLSSLEEQVV